MEGDLSTLFDIDGLVDVLRRCKLNNVILQFAENFLDRSVEVYLLLQSHLPSTNLFIIANSSWDMAIDDVGAMHVDGDVIVYFGTLLEVSSNLPVIALPPQRNMDLACCKNALLPLLSTVADANIVIFSDMSLHWAALRLSFELGNNSRAAELPAQVDLHKWSPTNMTTVLPSSGSRRLAGCVVDSKLISPATVFVFIGERNRQMDNLMLRYSQNQLIHYCPTDQTARQCRGVDATELRERYGGVFKAKEAQTVGIIISTMGLRVDIMKACLNRLQTLLAAAGKRYYSFILGRINEAKLCNFPEVDIFCIISTEDTSMIKPKTFHVPVVTVFELEVGIGAREWDSMLMNSLEEVVSCNLDDCVRNVREALGEDLEEVQSVDSAGVNIIKLEDLTSQAVQARADQSLTLFNSAALEFFQSRTFKGLKESSEEDADLDIHMGQLGIAASYVQIADPAARDIEDL